MNTENAGFVRESYLRGKGKFQNEAQSILTHFIPHDLGEPFALPAEKFRCFFLLYRDYYNNSWDDWDKLYYERAVVENEIKQLRENGHLIEIDPALAINWRRNCHGGKHPHGDSDIESVRNRMERELETLMDTFVSTSYSQLKTVLDISRAQNEVRS